jgi:hypothetical protein
MQARNVNDIIGLALQDIVGDSLQMGSGGAMTLELFKIQGRWIAMRAKSSMSGAVSSDAGVFDVEQWLATPNTSPACSVITKKVKDDAAAADARAAKEQEEERQSVAWERSAQLRDPVKGIPFQLLSDVEHSAIAQLLFLHAQPGEKYPEFRALVQQFPVIPKANQWLPIGTTMESDGFPPISIDNYSGQRHLLMVRITSGAHAGDHALIENETYGTFDRADPGKVYGTQEEEDREDLRRRSEKFEREAARERTIVRDSVLGVPFLRLNPAEFDRLRATYPAQGLSTGSAFDKQLEIWKSIDKRFPDHPSQAQWLAPGTEFESPCLQLSRKQACERHMTYGRYVIIRPITGLNAGAIAVIDLRNWGSNIHQICQPEYETLRC